MTRLLRDKTAELNNSIILPTMIISCRHDSSSSYYGPLLALLQTPYERRLRSYDARTYAFRCKGDDCEVTVRCHEIIIQNNNNNDLFVLCVQ